MSAASFRIVLNAFGCVVGIDVPAVYRDYVRERLNFAYVDAVGEPEMVWGVMGADDGWMVSRDIAPITYVSDPEHAIELMLSDLELWVAEMAPGWIFLHAGCVVVDDRAIVAPGRTMTGKSSLTAALVRAGATYYSDEYAVLDAAGQVRPYPRPLSIRPYDGGPAVRQHASEFGGVTGSEPMPVGMVAALAFDPDAGWAVEELTRGPAVLRLLDNTVAARSRTDAALDALDLATQGAILLGGTRGDADDAAVLLIDALRAG